MYTNRTFTINLPNRLQSSQHTKYTTRINLKLVITHDFNMYRKVLSIINIHVLFQETDTWPCVPLIYFSLIFGVSA